MKKLNEETKKRIENAFQKAVIMTKSEYYNAVYEVRKDATFPFFFGVLESYFRSELEIDLESIWKERSDIRYHD